MKKITSSDRLLTSYQSAATRYGQIFGGKLLLSIVFFLSSSFRQIPSAFSLTYLLPIDYGRHRSTGESRSDFNGDANHFNGDANHFNDDANHFNDADHFNDLGSRTGE